MLRAARVVTSHQVGVFIVSASGKNTSIRKLFSCANMGSHTAIYLMISFFEPPTLQDVTSGS